MRGLDPRILFVCGWKKDSRVKPGYDDKVGRLLVDETLPPLVMRGHDPRILFLATGEKDTRVKPGYEERWGDGRT